MAKTKDDIRREAILKEVMSSDDTIMPMRALTPSDYLAAARLVATCKTDRLKLVLELLAEGGWKIPEVAKATVVDTSDLPSRLQETMEATGLSLREIADLLNISGEVMRAYMTRRRYPRPARYEEIVRSLEVIGAESAVG